MNIAILGLSGCGNGRLKDLMASGSISDTGPTTLGGDGNGVVVRRFGSAEVTQPPSWRGKETFEAVNASGAVLCEYEWRTDNLTSVDPATTDPLETNCADRANERCRFSFTILRQDGEIKAGTECGDFGLTDEDAEGTGYGYHDDYDDGSGPAGVSFLGFEDDGSGGCCWTPLGGTASFETNEINYDYPVDD